MPKKKFLRIRRIFSKYKDFLTVANKLKKKNFLKIGYTQKQIQKALVAFDVTVLETISIIKKMISHFLFVLGTLL